MAGSEEWQERHLTPDGWISGSCKVDGQGRTDVDPPANRVLTVRYEEIWSIDMPSIKKRTIVMWEGKDQDVTQELLAKYGEAPTGL
jgi:hypothetical protein